MSAMNPSISLRRNGDHRVTARPLRSNRLGKLVMVAALVAGATVAAATPSKAATDDGSDGKSVHGMGATFPAPLYAAWAEDYRRDTGITVRYDPQGSGAGIRAMREGGYDF